MEQDDRARTHFLHGISSRKSIRILGGYHAKHTSVQANVSAVEAVNCESTSTQGADSPEEVSVMPGDQKHHTDKWRRCVQDVMAKGYPNESAAAVCTTSLQNAGEPIFEGLEARSAEEIRLLGEHTTTGKMEELHLCGATGPARYEMLNGRRHLVVPVVALMEGVIHPVNADTPEFVSAEVLRRAAASWVGKPVTLGHPKRNGTQCSAGDAEVRKEAGIGVLMKSECNGKKLFQEAWIDEEKGKQLHPSLYKDLENGKPVDVSVGAFVVTNAKESIFNGKSYKYEWLGTSGDHLAFLPGGRGACSGEMGCGAHRAASMHLVTASSIEPIEDLNGEVIVRALEHMVAAKAKYEDCPICKGSGNVDGNPCEACDSKGEIKVAAGARHSAADVKMIQTVHDHAVSLGATCDRKNLEAAAAINEIKHEGGKYVLYSVDGKRKLAEHSSMRAAEEHRDALKAALVRRAS